MDRMQFCTSGILLGLWMYKQLYPSKKEYDSCLQL